ncbi:MAG: hypothetical protein Q8M29_08760 [Bacteroidota bacterium]|nr:hypothetical protein [Bacteroidota bacterium]
MKNKNQSTCSKLFTMRIDEATRKKIEDLASNKVFKYNNSALIKHLISAEHAKQFNTNGN